MPSPFAVAALPQQRLPLAERFAVTRRFTETLTGPLSAEDCIVQSMPDASPTKWHLGHTTWFFEEFVLAPRGEARYDDRFAFLFNSYYNLVGDRQPRPKRGMLTRPGLGEVMAYRDVVTERVEKLLRAGKLDDEARRIVEIGVNHEQQHQELLLTDIKHALSQNPLLPAYQEESAQAAGAAAAAGGAPDMQWLEHDEGLFEIGADPEDGFCYDCEGPRHRAHVAPFALASRPVTNAEYVRFMADGGYERADLWLDLGWAAVQHELWRAPMYWRRDGDRWMRFTLAGEREVDPAAPVSHISSFEADAYARWAGARLPTEQEWEIVCADEPVEGNFAEAGALDPVAASGADLQPAGASGAGLQPAGDGSALVQVFGDVWEWTRSHFSPYPGYSAEPGPLGEYNGKFMCNQFVLRGGSCATPASHVRASYRNFFHPGARWQFAGLRLAKDL